MARISDLKNLMDDGWEINIKGKSQDELNVISALVNYMDAKEQKKNLYYKKPPKNTEIVTCKDCKYRDPEDKFCDCGHMIRWSGPREDDFYCADGERIK